MMNRHFFVWTIRHGVYRPNPRFLSQILAKSMNVLEELADRVVARIGDRQRLQSELLPRLERRQAR